MLVQRPNCVRAGVAYGRSLDDCAGLDNLLLVQLRAGTVEVADNRRHTRLVAHGGRQVNGLLGVILGEAGCRSKRAVATFGRRRQHLPLDLASVAGRTLARQECQRPVAGGFELPVGHGEFDVLWLVVVEVVEEVRPKKRSDEYCCGRSERTALAASGMGCFQCPGPWRYGGLGQPPTKQ